MRVVDFRDNTKYNQAHFSFIWKTQKLYLQTHLY